MRKSIRLKARCYYKKKDYKLTLCCYYQRDDQKNIPPTYEITLTNFRNNYPSRINYVHFNEEYINFIRELRAKGPRKVSASNKIMF